MRTQYFQILADNNSQKMILQYVRARTLATACPVSVSCGEMILQNEMKMWSYGHLPESVTENVVFAQDGHNL